MAFYEPTTNPDPYEAARQTYGDQSGTINSPTLDIMASPSSEKKATNSVAKVRHFSAPDVKPIQEPEPEGRTVTPRIIGGLDQDIPEQATDIPGTPADKSADALSSLAEDSEALRDQRLALAGTKFLLDFMNANSAYAAYKGAAYLNRTNARMQANDAIRRGRQRSLEERELGIDRGDQAALALASQGQDVSGAHVEAVRDSYETVGIYNGLQEETNSIREALGFELEEVAIDYELAQRNIQRENTIISSALQFGATAYANSDYGSGII